MKEAWNQLGLRDLNAATTTAASDLPLHQAWELEIDAHSRHWSGLRHVIANGVEAPGNARVGRGLVVVVERGHHL
jgi:hypothetical protein